MMENEEKQDRLEEQPEPRPADVPAEESAAETSDAFAESEQTESADETAAIPAAENTKKPRRKWKMPRVSLVVLLVFMLIAAIISFQVTSIFVSLAYKEKIAGMEQSIKSLYKLEDISELFEKYSLYDCDTSSLDEALSEAYVYGYGDRFAYYYTAEEWEEETKESTGNTVGFGILVTLASDGGLLVTQVYADSPAEKAGISVGDILKEVDGLSLVGMTLNDAVAEVRGEIGTTAEAKILRGETELTVSVTRNTYEIEVISYKMLEQDGKKLGYIHWEEFVEIAVDQFTDAVKALLADGAEGLIFDLRNNGGGDLNAVVDMLDFLLPKGTIATLRMSTGETSAYTSDASEIDIPMTVLTNGSTASAAELFTIALRDYDKAKSIGTLTFGKGCGQSGFGLSDGSVVFVTSFYYDPPKSENFNGVGITPDIEVELPENYRSSAVSLIPAEEDTQLQAAIRLLLEEK